LTVGGSGFVREFEVEPGGPENGVVLEIYRCSIVAGKGRERINESDCASFKIDGKA